MLDWLAWLEASALPEFVRNSGPYTYGIVNLFHVFGIALLFGAILVLDLRMLGAWRATPIAALARPIVPVAGAGLVLALLSGVTLFSVQATEYYYNPFLYVKLAALGLGIVNLVALHASAPWKEMTRSGAPGSGGARLVVGAVVSLASWITVITAGRMIAYW